MKRLISVLIVLAMLLSICPIAVVSADDSEFEISGNKLEDIASLSALTKLDILDFSYNQVASLPNWPDGCPLRVLDGSYNVLESLAPLKNMHQLTYLYMDYNKLTSVDAIASCYCLVQVNVYGNEIEDVSALTEHDIIVNWDPTNKD